MSNIVDIRLLAWDVVRDEFRKCYRRKDFGASLAVERKYRPFCAPGLVPVRVGGDIQSCVFCGTQISDRWVAMPGTMSQSACVPCFEGWHRG